MKHGLPISHPGLLPPLHPGRRFDLGIVNKAFTVSWLGFPSEWLHPTLGLLLHQTLSSFHSTLSVVVLMLSFLSISSLNHFKDCVVHTTTSYHYLHFSLSKPPFYFSEWTIKTNSCTWLFKETFLLQIISRQRRESQIGPAVEVKRRWRCALHRPMSNVGVLHVVCLSSDTCSCLWKPVELWYVSVEQPLPGLGWRFIVT